MIRFLRITAAVMISGTGVGDQTMTELMGPSAFMPHGVCYLWESTLVWLHVSTDSLIALAYYVLPVLLVYVVRKRTDLPFNWMFCLFGAFIVACGTTHAVAVLNLWVPAYWLAGAVKAATATVSLLTAALLWPTIPKALALPSPAQLAALNRELEAEVKERRRAEAALGTALAHREVLLREVHHRVKNNLQMVGSLMRLQARALTEPAERAPFAAAQQRLQAIALMHSVLDPAQGVVEVDCQRYLGQLAAHLAQVYGTAARAIRLAVEAPGVALAPEVALPCGLIVHELVANALTHAFPEGRAGAVEVTLARAGEALTLTVRDTGIGLPAAVSVASADSLGFRLVRALAGQLGGGLEVTVDGGTLVRLTFTEAEGH
jgi:two-component sensor histidine kinase